jgi:putative ABC transport system ATP-binding protein
MLIELRQVERSFLRGRTAVAGLRETSLVISPGEFVVILGPSGSGKSTLMNLIGLLDRPTAGALLLDGVDCAELDGNGLALLRNRRIGLVFQSYHLLARQTVIENVELPLTYAGVPRPERRRRARRVIERVKLGHRIDHMPAVLSGGEQQRAAIARAIVSEAEVLLADEPTGALDSSTGLEIMDILLEINREGRTVVMVTHDETLARIASRVISMRDGRVVADSAQQLRMQRRRAL